MRCKDDSLTGADQITGVADDFGAGGTNIANRLAVVWVTKDDGTLDECRLVGSKHRGSVVNELPSLTVRN